MRTKKWFVAASGIAIVSLLLSSCAPAAAPTPAATKAPVVQPTEASARAVATPAAPMPTAKTATDAPKSGGTLGFAHFGDPISFDPIQESSVQSEGPVIPNYSGIVQRDPLEPAKVIGDLAEKWELSPDGLVYTFHLYKNVKWHDGSPFNAEDARFSLELVRKPPKGFNSPRQEWLAAVDKIEAPDKDTLRVTLQYPSASFINNLADGRMVVVPKAIFEAKGNMKRDIVGTGPYKFRSFTAGASFNVVKNPDYFIKGRPYLDGMTFYIIVDSATRFAALRTHRVHLTPFASQGLTPTQSGIIRKEMNDKINVQKYSGLSWLSWWAPLNKPPWDDVRVRRALEMTIDRANVLKVAREGVGDIGAFMPPGAWSLPVDELMKSPGYRPNKEADIAEAKRLMAEAGYAGGIKTTTITRNTTQMERSVVALKEQLAQIGIDITVSLKDAATVYDLLYKRAYESAVFSGTASDDDPDQIMSYYVTGSLRNFGDYSDEKYDNWFNEQARTIDPVKRKAIVLDMQRRMLEQVSSSMLHWIVYELGSWREVRDLKPGMGIYNNLKFQNVWLDK